MIKVTLTQCETVKYINPQQIVEMFATYDYGASCKCTYIHTVVGGHKYKEPIEDVLLQIERGILWVS
jgi:hypothetical protein